MGITHLIGSLSFGGVGAPPFGRLHEASAKRNRTQQITAKIRFRFIDSILFNKPPAEVGGLLL